MRTHGVLVIGFALFTLTSCSDAPSDVPDASNGHDGATVQNVQPVNSSAPHAAGDSSATADREAHAASSEADHPGRHGHDQRAATTGHDDNGRAQRGHGGQRHGHGRRHSESGDVAPKIAIGEKVPDFEVTLNGKVWKLSELRKNAEITPDGTLVLTFWCSFCHSCRHVELDLDKLAKNYQGKAGVIALDASFGEIAEDVAAFAEKRGLTLPIALNANGSVADLFGVSRTTTTMVIDSEGTLRYFGQFGDRQHAYAEEALDAVLAGSDVPVERTRPKG